MGTAALTRSAAVVDATRWKSLAIVCAAYFMTVLDVSIVNVALPSIGKSLHFSQEDLQWVITAYAITFGGFLLLGGRAADLLGRRRMFYAGVTLFTTASFLCGLAWSGSVLIGARALQGLGAAIISPAALSIVMTSFDEGPERNKALGVWGAIGGSGAAVGVLAGGLLTKYLGWEWIFFVNVPVGATALLLAPRFVRESRSDREHTHDIAGAVAITAGLGLLVYGVTEAANHGWSSSWTIVRLSAAAVLLIAFTLIEARAKDPLMPFRIFKVSTVAGANVAGLLLGAVVFTNFFLLTLYVQNVLQWSALKTGLTFMATAGTAIIWAGLAQALTTKIGPKIVMAFGFIAMTAGMAWYTQIPVHASYWSDLLPGYLLVGFALPFTYIPVSIAALAGVKQDDAGLASGLINTAQQIGGAIGIAVASSVLISHSSLLLRHRDSFPTAFTSGTHWAFWVAVVIAAAGAVVTVALVHDNEPDNVEGVALI